MKKRIVFIFLIFLLVLIFILLLIEYKKGNLGNNISKEDILNISSYEATIEVEVYSNKNTNKYIINQKYKEPNIFKQEVLEPKSLSGVIIISQGNNVTVESKNLELKAIYENFNRRCFKFKFNQFYQ